MDIRNATPEQRAELNKLILGALKTEHRKTKLNNADALKAWDISTRKDYQKFVVIWNGGEISYDYNNCVEYKANKNCMPYRVSTNEHGTHSGYPNPWRIDYVGLLIAQRTGEHTMGNKFVGNYSPKRHSYYRTYHKADNELHSRHQDYYHKLYVLQRTRNDVKGDIAWDEKRLKDYEKDIKKALYDLQYAYEQQAQLKISLAKRKEKMEDNIEKANADIRELMQKVRRGEKVERWGY